MASGPDHPSRTLLLIPPVSLQSEMSETPHIGDIAHPGQKALSISRPRPRRIDPLPSLQRTLIPVHTHSLYPHPGRINHSPNGQHLQLISASAIWDSQAQEQFQAGMTATSSYTAGVSLPLATRDSWASLREKVSSPNCTSVSLTIKWDHCMEMPLVSPSP